MGSVVYELTGGPYDDGNYTDSYDNYTDIDDNYCGADKMDMQVFNVTFQSVLYSFIFLLGVAGNGLMITVLLRRGRVLRITEIYLLHLAVADLMLLFTFPFNVAETLGEWLFGEFLCKLMGLVKNLNIFCGSLLLACIGFDRYLAIVRAIPSLQSRRPRTVHLLCISLWLVCLALSIPNVVFLSVSRTNTSKLTCFYSNYEMHSNNWVLTNRVFEHVCFFLPLAVMSYCYTAVVITLRSSQKSQATKGAIRLALLITVIFCFCWLPYNITLLIDTLAEVQVIKYEKCSYYVATQAAVDVTRSLGFSHCCLNPFLYAFVGVRFRNELIQLLCKAGCSRLCLPFTKAQSHSRPSVSEGVTTTSSYVFM
ncbi:C-X-C chemokine receptor type 5 [Betta splendens]|uniref:C-X-C chemokine receptor type 5 n=1 Tax=Betta splendens TaxID=158456 RepID=A0A6P7P736_BETSP|nr:C-X-C chemokine receptor type 5 [Betta splendens]